MLNNAQKEIRNFINNRHIDELVHFTYVDNLESILENGLLPVRDLYYNRINHYYNDENRLEGRRDAVCLSISFPNYKMFFKYRHYDNDNWCVIGLDPSILYEKDCLFCITNAASNYETRRNNYDKKNLRGLSKLFYDDGYRYEENIPLSYPTDPQAEVLVLDKIETPYINSIYFPSNNDKYNFFRENYEPSYYNENYRFKIDKRFLAPRKDYKNW